MHKILITLALALAGSAHAAPWQRIDNPPPVIGADGREHTASCSAYPGTDPGFRFWARKGLSPNLVVYFEGGGACWDDLTCSFPIRRGLPGAIPQFFTPDIPRSTRPREFVGLFDATRADNPVKDWTVVYIPYCTGDVHIGSADKTYRDAGHPIIDLPAEFAIRHRGFDNFMVVLDWMAKNVKAPRQVLVTGASAGGYGASANFPWVAQQFPGAKIAVLADASQGVTTENFDTGPNARVHWNPQLAPWVFGPDASVVRSGELLRIGAQAYPDARVAQYTNVQDGVQVGFYGYMEAAYGPGGSCADVTADWNRQMLDTLGSYAASLPNFRYFLTPGTAHTMLRGPEYYDLGVAPWLGTMLDRRRAAPAWEHVACPDCLSALPCP